MSLSGCTNCNELLQFVCENKGIDGRTDDRRKLPIVVQDATRIDAGLEVVR
jgi:hypothetical protein